MTSNSSDPIPEMMQPVWDGIDFDKIPVKLGQVLKINTENQELKAIVLDLNIEEGRTWVGLCLANEDKLFGRQIPNGMVFTTCLDLMDMAYISIDDLNEFGVSETLKLDKNKIGIGAMRYVNDLTELETVFIEGVKQRQKKQTPYKKVFAGQNAVRECYFDLEKVKY